MLPFLSQSDYSIQHAYVEASFDSGLMRYRVRKRGLSFDMIAHQCSTPTVSTSTIYTLQDENRKTMESNFAFTSKFWFLKLLYGSGGNPTYFFVAKPPWLISNRLILVACFHFWQFTHPCIGFQRLCLPVLNFPYMGIHSHSMTTPSILRSLIPVSIGIPTLLFRWNGTPIVMVY